MQGKRFSFSSNAKALAFAASTLALSGCVQEDYLPRNSRHYVPLPTSTLNLMNEKGMTKEAPILIRSYKQESELEIWKRASDGKYALLKSFPMCRWSGQLGPKMREGDRQVPEGFYTLTPGQLNPNSSYYVAMNVGYPNALDKAYGRTGGLIMVHGACSSAGCMSMTDEQIAEIYALTREAFTGGQQQVQIQSMPFRMTPKNLAKFRADPNIAFWKNIKEGSDHFDVTKQEPKVAVCGKKYVFNATSKGGSFDASSACPPMEVEPSLASAVAEKKHEDEIKTAQLAAQGEHAMRRVYVDGDQHPSFRSTVTADGTVRTRAGRHVDVSQLSALEGVRDIPVEDRSGIKTPKASVSNVAAVEQPSTAGAVASSASKPETAKIVILPANPATNAAPALASASVPVPGTGAPVATVPAAPVLAAAPPSNASPFYKRWLGLGEQGSSEEARAEAPAEAATPQPLSAPLPPKAPVRHSDAKSSPLKDKQTYLPPLLNGAKPVLPAGVMAFAPATL